MSDDNLEADLREHHEKNLRSRRKAITQWAILLAAFASLAAAAVICAPALAERGQLWVLGLFVVAGCGFVYVLSSVDHDSRALWPTGINHFTAAIKSTSPRSGS